MKLLSILTVEISQYGGMTGRQFVATDSVSTYKILNANRYEFYQIFKIYENSVPRLFTEKMPKNTMITGFYSSGTSRSYHMEDY